MVGTNIYQTNNSGAKMSLVSILFVLNLGRIVLQPDGSNVNSLFQGLLGSDRINPACLTDVIFCKSERSHLGQPLLFCCTPSQYPALFLALGSQQPMLANDRKRFNNNDKG